ncbi:MAG: glutaredoxin family protein [Bacillota bacterium]
MDELKLYYFPSCPYCQKVLDFLDEHDIEVDLVDINEVEGARKTLKDKGGKAQVPCLFIEDEPLYESDDIIEWFKDNYIE